MAREQGRRVPYSRYLDRMARGLITDPFLELLARHKALYDAQLQAGTPGQDRPAPSPGHEELIPVESYLGTGRTPPPGTPRQTAWAIDIKTGLWYQLAPLLKKYWFKNSNMCYWSVLSALAQVGYPPEVAPLLRSAFCAHLLDLLDRKEARFWIEVEVEAREIPRYLPAMPMTKAERAVSRFNVCDRVSIEGFVERHPTPDAWRAELSRRGLRADEIVTEFERERFASFGPGKRAPVAKDADASPRRSP